MGIKVWLDDVRVAPQDWTHVYWPNEAIDLLKQGNVTHLSLDHDLGNDNRGTGYDVLLWLEEEVACHSLVLPSINIHSANVSARRKMLLAIGKIESLYLKSLQDETKDLLRTWISYGDKTHVLRGAPIDEDLLLSEKRYGWEDVQELLPLFMHKLYFRHTDRVGQYHATEETFIFGGPIAIINANEIIVGTYQDIDELVEHGWLLDQGFELQENH